MVGIVGPGRAGRVGVDRVQMPAAQRVGRVRDPVEDRSSVAQQRVVGRPTRASGRCTGRRARAGRTDRGRRPRSRRTVIETVLRIGAVGLPLDHVVAVQRHHQLVASDGTARVGRGFRLRQPELRPAGLAEEAGRGGRRRLGRNAMAGRQRVGGQRRSRQEQVRLRPLVRLRLDLRLRRGVHGPSERRNVRVPRQHAHVHDGGRPHVYRASLVGDGAVLRAGGERGEVGEHGDARQDDGEPEREAPHGIRAAHASPC